MNYRHQFHAGNFADVMKHLVLVRLLRALQQKPKGFVFLDTHAGRGLYDLTVASRGDSLARAAEWPNGIGRLWNEPSELPAVQEYLGVVRQLNLERGGEAGALRYYPGSPWFARALARTQDRLVLCEAHPAEHASLAARLHGAPRVSVQQVDGYQAIEATLPPAERRALVLIDPPYEAQDEFTRIVTSVRSGLVRLPGAVFAIWYPLTERARLDHFFAGLLGAGLPPTVTFELTVAGEHSALKLRGCGVMVVNPPWQLPAALTPDLEALAPRLAQGPGAAAHCHWLVPEQ